MSSTMQMIADAVQLRVKRGVLRVPTEYTSAGGLLVRPGPRIALFRRYSAALGSWSTAKMAGERVR